MDTDMLSKISEMLSNPESADKIKQIASSMFNSTPENNISEDTAKNNISEDTAKNNINIDKVESQPSVGAFSEKDFGKLANIFSGSGLRNNREVNLLRAILPYMRQSRADKISSAIKAIQIISILSALK